MLCWSVTAALNSTLNLFSFGDEGTIKQKEACI